MEHVSEEPREESTLPDLPEPGIKRRRMLRAAGFNIRIEDFTSEERIARGFRRGGARPKSLHG